MPMRRGAFIRAADTLAAAVVGVAAVAAFASCRPRSRSTGRGLLVFDSAFDLDEILSRGLQHSVTSRDLGGWFDHVWTVHPMVGAADGADGAGPVTVTELAPRHTVVEAPVVPTPRLTRWPTLGFALAQLALARALRGVVAGGGVSAVRVGDPYYQGLVGLLVARRAGVPLVVRVNANYDLIYETVGRPAYPRLFRSRAIEKRVERFVLRRADLVAGANHDNLAFALANGADARRSTVFPYGSLIDPTHLTEPSTRHDPVRDLGEPRPYLLVVSRLESVKHVEDVVDVLARVRERGHDVAAVVVGEGSLEPALRAAASEQGVADALRLTGARSQSWIAGAAAGAAVVLCPRAGRALVEAALGGRPVVAYDVEWHAELLDERTGVLVPHRDTAAMADAVVALLDNPAMAQDLGTAGRRRALETMDPERLRHAELAAYARLVR